MATRIQLRRGTAAQWTSANPVLASGEPAVETDTGKRKIGDGVTAWADLPYDVSPDELAGKANTADLGTAAAADVTAFATAEQGGKADTAVQPEALEPLTPGPGEVIVGTVDGPRARDVSEIGGVTASPDVVTAQFEGAAASYPLANFRPERGAVWATWAGSATVREAGLAPDYGAAADPLVAVQHQVGVDVAAEMTMTVGRVGGAGVVVRGVDANNYWFSWFESNSKGLQLRRVQSGTQTLIRSVVIPGIASGDTITLRTTAYGDFISVEVVGGVRLTHQGVPQQGTSVGIRAIYSSNPTLYVRSFRAWRQPAPATPYLPILVSGGNAAAPVALPQMYGAWEGTHPDVLDTGTPGWQGWRYWMIYTPYPDGTPTENPTLVASNDGDTWAIPPGVPAPIFGPPDDGYYSDPDMVLVDGTLYVYFRQSYQPAGSWSQRILLTTSHDGKTWTPLQTVLEEPGNASAVAPSVLHVDGRWHMWLIDAASSTRSTLRRLTSKNPQGPWVEEECALHDVPDWRWWHGNVIRSAGVYYALISDAEVGGSGAGANGRILFATSFDGLTWSRSATPVLSPGASGAWDDGKLYRAAMVPTAAGLDVWYSALSSDDLWNIGRTQVTFG